MATSRSGLTPGASRSGFTPETSRSGLTPETSSLSSFEQDRNLSETDRQRLFKVIDFGVTAWRCSHFLEDAPPHRYAVQFLHMPERQVKLMCLPSLVALIGRALRRIDIIWGYREEGGHAETLGIPDDVQVRVEIAQFGKERVDPPPVFTVGDWKEMHFADLIKAMPADAEPPEDWDDALHKANLMAHLIYNRKQDIPPYQSSILTHPTRRTYTLEISVMDDMEYPVFAACSQVAWLDSIVCFVDKRAMWIRFSSQEPQPWAQLATSDRVVKEDESDERPLKMSRSQDSL